MKLSESEIEKLILEGATRLLARASDQRSLTAQSLVFRVRAAVDKYLLRANENARAEELSAFVDGLQADDL